ncbi:MAG: RagB/SusD family nutrient uptake outer membrane protein [Cyclobacteriaceae bacterium]
MKKNILFFVVFAMSLFSCEDLFEPAIQNNRDIDEIYNEPKFAYGLVINGYTRIPTNGWDYSDMATDNATSNIESNAFYTMATGQWASNNNPVSQWQNSKAAIQYMNIALAEMDSVTFSENVPVNAMFTDRVKGEAYGLRALFMYYLLRAHGGESDGELLGVPIILDPENGQSDFNQARATFEACMQQLYADVEKAIELLPVDYANIGDEADIPTKYFDIGAAVDDYNRVFGDDARLLFTERIARSVRAQASLMASSPAFSGGNTTTWEEAANYAAEVIDLNNGIAGIDPNGVVWYTDQGSQITNAGSGLSPGEIIWRSDMGGPSSNLEEDNYPPTLFGDGLINPTQNLVDAFPMANGYPIVNPSSGFDPANPYANRDPRLNQFIQVNGSTAGPNGTVINTSVDGGTIDGLNQVETSTRTGYYMRKLLRQDVNLNPVSVNGQLHINPRIRYTEIYLAYAEAANEAFGPMGTGTHAYSAYDVIHALRERAGVGASNDDAYLESIKGDQAAMRTLIRNERRLELSFEGFRFWDLRRWNLDLTEAARGVSITGGQHQIISVDNRVYSDYMIYGPVPYSEILKFNALEQNTGW